MYITHSYVGSTFGSVKYRFFALYEDYNDFGRAFVREFNIRLERLARDLGHDSAVITPFLGDIETTRGHVLDLDWTHDELSEVRKSPSLLVIQCEFDDFSPRNAPWMIFHFGEARHGDHRGLAELDETIRGIVWAVNGPTDGKLFELAKEVADFDPDATKVFNAQPGAFGFSVDIIEAGKQFRELIRGKKRRIGQE